MNGKTIPRQCAPAFNPACNMRRQCDMFQSFANRPLVRVNGLGNPRLQNSCLAVVSEQGHHISTSRRTSNNFLNRLFRQNDQFLIQQEVN